MADDKIPVRVFDSVTAAVENSLPPEAPPYAEIQNPQAAVSGPETPDPVPPARKAPAKRTQAKGKAAPVPIQEEPVTGVTVQAGTAKVQAKAHGTK
jgi:hypothetical protein